MKYKYNAICKYKILQHGTVARTWACMTSTILSLILFILRAAILIQYKSFSNKLHKTILQITSMFEILSLVSTRRILHSSNPYCDIVILWYCDIVILWYMSLKTAIQEYKYLNLVTIAGMFSRNEKCTNFNILDSSRLRKIRSPPKIIHEKRSLFSAWSHKFTFSLNSFLWQVAELTGCQWSVSVSTRMQHVTGIPDICPFFYVTNFWGLEL